MITIEDLAKAHPSITFTVSGERVRVANSALIQREMIKNVAPVETFGEQQKRLTREFVANCDRLRQQNLSTPSGQKLLTAGTPREATLAKVFKEVSQKWSTSTEEMPYKPDPSVALAVAFGGKPPRPAPGAEVFAQLSNAWRR
jgi:hypothetical protein